MAKAHVPGRTISTAGVNAAAAAATGSNARASRPGSSATTTSHGQRDSACRRRNPRSTPSARAASEHATTRFAATTATAAPGPAFGPVPANW